MDIRRRPLPRRDVPLGMVFDETLRGVVGQRRRQLLRRVDEEPHERDDQLQRWLPPLQLLHRSDGRGRRVIKQE